MKMKHITVIILNVLFLLLFMILFIIAGKLIDSLPSQKAVERWASDDTKYTQSSLFLDEANGVSIENVYMFRANIDKGLTENSIKGKSFQLPDGTVKETGRLWMDAYSGNSSMKISNEKANITADTIITGGDYFLFHPLTLLSGSYYSDNDIMKDGVIIDEDLAWQLFGSSNVVGMPVTIDKSNFYVSGVVKKETDKASRTVYGEKPKMYIQYETAKKINSNILITCYEACLPNPVVGIGHKIFSENVSSDENNRVIIENTTRYSLKNLFKIASSFAVSSVRTDAVILPYWENAARIVENKAALLLVLMCITLVTPFLTVVYFINKLIKNRKKIFIKAFEGLKSNVYNLKQLKQKKHA